MSYDDYREHIAEMEANDPAFREACERLRPQFEFRKALIGARIAAGLTQKQLAERMGTSQAAIARLERGTGLPSVDTLYRLAVILGVDFTITPQEPLTVRPHRAA
ncbi:MAG: helix-turn-helix domain-containing protein [Chloroflexi bacterium]|nr:helix-turn-helix domain-containing protein [Chloroflexota bacterium]